MTDAKASARGAPGKRVLLVDDDPTVLRALARVLHAAGCETVTCSNGAGAVTLIETEAFDVVVSDIGMPGLGGIELLKLIRARAIEVPVLLVTGSPALESAVEAVEYGAFKYLMKPIEHEALLDAIQRATGPQSGVSRDRRGGGPASTPGPASRELARPRAAAPGTVLAGRYELIRRVGQGGMGEVWEATQLLTRRSVAMKLLRASLGERPEMRSRLLREARAAAAIAHPNIVDIYDVFELDDGTPVIVMALLRGSTLGSALARDGRWTLTRSAELMLPVVSAVGAAHASGVIHRDLKPDNVFLSEDGGLVHVKVVDFGIAKLVSGHELELGAMTETGAVLGTPGYMAPEQVFGERDIDHRADIWSIGAMLYETLSGTRALAGDNIGQVLKRLVMQGVAPISSHVPDLEQDFAALLDRMLSTERDARPADLREVYDELARRTNTVAPRFGAPRASLAQLGG
jgi:CheY-like chemotaxis protein